MPPITEKTNEILLSNYFRYMNIANKACNKAKDSALKRNALVNEKGIDHEALIEAAGDVHDEAMIAVVFAAMAIEAFINEYGISKFSSNYFKTHLDKLNILSKLVIIPKLSGTSELKTDGQVYQDVKWLIEFRNHLVHFRSKKKTSKDIDMTNPMSQKDFVLESHAERSVKAMSQLIESLSELKQKRL